MRTALAMFLAPFFWMFVEWALSPLRRLLERRLPEGHAKRFLLKPVLTEYFGQFDPKRD